MPKVILPLTEFEYEKMQLTRGDCLAIKRLKKMSDSTWTEYLVGIADDIANFYNFGMTIFGIERNWNEIRLISEEQMRLYGWIRKEKVFATTDEAWEMIQGKYEELTREYHTQMEEEE
jgi:hypothetical protein